MPTPTWRAAALLYRQGAPGQPPLAAFLPRRVGVCVAPPTNGEFSIVAAPDPRSLPSTLHVVLEDLTAAFHRPCIADIKLGTRHHGDDAPPEKAALHEEKARSTTSHSLGLRLCGFCHMQGGELVRHSKRLGRTPEAGQFAARPAALRGESGGTWGRERLLGVGGRKR